MREKDAKPFLSHSVGHLAELSEDIKVVRWEEEGVAVDIENGGQCLKFTWSKLDKEKHYLPSESYPDTATANAEAGEEQKEEDPLLDCFDLGIMMNVSAWYGGAERYEEKWPTSRNSFDMSTFSSHDNYADHTKAGSVLEPRWIGDRGTALLIDSHVTFSVQSQGDGSLCVETPAKTIVYELCTADDIRGVHQYLLEKRTPHPASRPAAAMFEKPIWSTWANYRANITQDKVLEYANRIQQYGFEGSNLEIDDKWFELGTLALLLVTITVVFICRQDLISLHMDCQITHRSAEYGDFTFDPVKFPDPKGMISQLHAMGFTVTCWVMPFAANTSKAYLEGMQNGYFVKGENGGIVEWWQGEGMVLDVTNPSAVKWFVDRLNKLKKLGVDSFKFDAGEVVYLPQNPKFFKPLLQLADYTTQWTAIAAKFAPLAEVRCVLAL